MILVRTFYFSKFPTCCNNLKKSFEGFWFNFFTRLGVFAKLHFVCSSHSVESLVGQVFAPTIAVEKLHSCLKILNSITKTRRIQGVK